MKTTLQSVRDYCTELKKTRPVESASTEEEDMPSVAPGSEQDKEAHKNDELKLEPVSVDFNYKPLADEDEPQIHAKSKRAKLGMGGARSVKGTSDEDWASRPWSDGEGDSSDDELAVAEAQVAFEE